MGTPFQVLSMLCFPESSAIFLLLGIEIGCIDDWLIVFGHVGVSNNICMKSTTPEDQVLVCSLIFPSTFQSQNLARNSFNHASGRLTTATWRLTKYVLDSSHKQQKKVHQPIIVFLPLVTSYYGSSWCIPRPT